MQKNDFEEANIPPGCFRLPSMTKLQYNAAHCVFVIQTIYHSTTQSWVGIRKARIDIRYSKIPIPILTPVFTVPKNTEYQR